MHSIINTAPCTPQEPVIEVDLTWIAGKIEHRIIFGNSLSEQSSDPLHKTVLFAPDKIFAVMRWASSDYGLTIVRLDILRGPRPGEGTRLPFVRPGVEILLRVAGWNDVQRVIQIVDAIRALGIDPADASPDYWVHVGNRLAAGQAPRSYTKGCHIVWKLKRRIAS